MLDSQMNFRQSCYNAVCMLALARGLHSDIVRIGAMLLSLSDSHQFNVLKIMTKLDEIHPLQCIDVDAVQV